MSNTSPKLLFVAVRVFFDALFLNIALLTSIVIHSFSFLVRQTHGFGFTLEAYLEIFNRYFNLWSRYALPITIGSILIFWLFGFYSGRYFSRFRYRVLFLVAGVAMSMSIAIFCIYLTASPKNFAREVMAWFFVLSLFLLVVPRISKGVLLYLAHLLESPKETHGSKAKRILVIGGAGYIGSTLCEYLLGKGYAVRAFDLMLFSKTSLAHLTTHKNFELFEGDFRNITDIAASLEGMDSVVHLGGLVGDPACAVNDSLTIDTNYAATKMIMDLCKGKGITRFVFASTCSVYGVGEKLLNEQSDLNPISLYARSKIDSENLLLTDQSSNFKPTILRFATVFGWSRRPRFDLVVNTFVAHALKHGKIEVFGGNQWRPFVHVLDLARAIEMTLEAPLKTVGGEIFNVGDDRLNCTITAVSQKVKDVLPECEVVNRGDTNDPRNYRVSFRKIKEKLHFECTVSVEDGIKELIYALEANKDIDISSKEYSNVQHLKHLVEMGSNSTHNKLHMADVLREGYVKTSLEKAA